MQIDHLRVDPATYIPIYRQIEDIFKTMIREGQLRPHDRVWSERELAGRFSVSRMTVRKAITNLIQEGYLFTSGSKGTFVSENRIDQPVLRLKNFFEEMSNLGLKADSRILGYREFEADERVAGTLNVPQGCKVFQIRRLMLGNDIPYAVETKCVIAEKCRLLQEWDGRESEILELLIGRCKECVSKFEIFIEATVLHDGEGSLFHLKHGSPALCLKRLAYDKENRVLSFTKSVYRGDLYRLSTTVEY